MRGRRIPLPALLSACAALCLLPNSHAQGASGPVSAEKSIIYGPAINRRVVTPARYLYVQAVDEQGRNFTSSPGANAFTAQVEIELEGGRRNQLKSQFHDRGDGSFQLFFFYGVQPTAIYIIIKAADGKYVGGQGPLRVKNPEIEQCYCPAPDPKDWMKHYGCRKEEPQLMKDFEKFPVISKEMMTRAVDTLSKVDRACFVHYVIRSNIVYAKAYGPYQGFKQYTDEMILSLARRVTLPDADFIWNLGDWPLANASAAGLPVISFCKNDDVDDIVVPTYKMTLATLFGKDLENVKDVDAKCSDIGKGWDRKIPKMVWRGRDSNVARTWFVDNVAGDPTHRHLFDANISKNQMDYYPSEELRQADKLLQAGKKVPRMNFMQFWRFKYLLSIDGTVAAYRLPALLAGDSLVFKQDSPWYEHFYAELEPYVHYIPLNIGLTDVVEKLEWARSNDAQAKQIATNARHFARERLHAEQVYCYYYMMLDVYNKRMDFPVEIPAGYEEARQPQVKQPCKCGPKPKKKRKKDKEKREGEEAPKEEL